MISLPITSDETRQTLRDVRIAAPGLMLASGIIALFPLAITLYILLFFDVALPGRSGSTLVGIGVLILLVIAVRGFFLTLRARMLIGLGDMMARRLTPRLDNAVARLVEEDGELAEDAAHAPSQLDILQDFIKSGTAAAWIDVAGLPIALIVMLFLHPFLALALLVMCGILLFMMNRTFAVSQAHIRAGVAATGQRQALAEAMTSGVDSMRALGMGRTLGNMWTGINHSIVNALNRMRRAHIKFSVIAHSMQYATLVVVLTVGGWLHMADRASEAVIIAAAILGWLALTPVVRAADGIDQLAHARRAWTSLDRIFGAVRRPLATVELPAPTRTLTCENMALGAPGMRRPLVQNISFQLNAGDVLAVLGRSGCGKSVMMRGLAGAWAIPVGKVRLDGAALDQWDSDMLAQHIGYLPQNIDLLDGTIADNIARFDHDANSQKVVAAAQAAGAHDMIVRLPEGYNMRVGNRGRRLSLAQAQSIALARAFYNNPFLLVLDAPTAHMDAAGEQIFARAVEQARDRGAIVIVAGTQSNLINIATHVMMMRDGTIGEFGTTDEVRKRVEKRRKEGSIESRKRPQDASPEGNAAPEQKHNPQPEQSEAEQQE